MTTTTSPPPQPTALPPGHSSVDAAADSAASLSSKDEQQQEQKERTLVDVTSLIENATSELSVSDPMVFVDFQLQDSMAAIEIMDPVMDCCQVPVVADDDAAGADSTTAAATTTTRRVSPRNPPKTLACEEYLSDEVLMWDNLTLQDVLLVGLENLTCLESLLDGSSVAESTFCCLYLFVLLEMKQKRSTLEQRTLYTTCLGFVKLTESVRTVIQHADIYEDEDFSMATHGLSFWSLEVDGGETRRTLMETMRELSQQQTQLDNEVDKETCQWLFHLVSFQSLFLEACATLATLSAASVSRNNNNTSASGSATTTPPPPGTPPSSSSSPPPPGPPDTVEQTQQKIRRAVQHNLQALRDSPLSRDLYNAKADVLVRAFDDTMNRRQMGNAPVRRVQFLPPLEALDAVSRVVSQLDTVVCQLLRVGPSLARIRRFLVLPSLGHSHEWHILTRSLVVLNLYFEDLLLGQYPLSRLIANDIQRTVGVPSSFWTQPQTSTFDFLSRLGKPTYDFLKLACLNPHRQGAYMNVVMIPDWCRQLPREAALMDSLPLSPPPPPQASPSSSSSSPKVANYVLQMGTILLDAHLRLGVQLQLVHQPHDLAVVYWYRDYLLSVLLSISTANLRHGTLLRKANHAPTHTKTRGGARGTKGDVEGGEETRKSPASSTTMTVSSRGAKKKKKRGGGKGAGGNPSLASLETTTTTTREDATTLSEPVAPEDATAAADKDDALEEEDAAAAEEEEWEMNQLEYMVLNLYRCLCRGIVRALALVTKMGLVSPPPLLGRDTDDDETGDATTTAAFTSPRCLFQRRFEFLSQVPQPPPLTHEEFLKSSDTSSMSRADLTALATDSFQSAKALVDKLLKQQQQVQLQLLEKNVVLKLAKVAMGNLLFLHKLSKEEEEEEAQDKGKEKDKKKKKKVSLDFSVHSHFCLFTMDSS